MRSCSTIVRRGVSACRNFRAMHLGGGILALQQRQSLCNPIEPCSGSLPSTCSRPRRHEFQASSLEPSSLRKFLTVGAQQGCRILDKFTELPNTLILDYGQPRFSSSTLQTSSHHNGQCACLKGLDGLEPPQLEVHLTRTGGT